MTSTSLRALTTKGV